jgi:hypothetical protein
MIDRGNYQPATMQEEVMKMTLFIRNYQDFPEEADRMWEAALNN